MAILELKELTLSLGGPPILQNINLHVEKGERICLLGRNGEGKTTLLRLLSGELKPDSGEVISKKGVRVGILPQEVPMDLEGTVSDIVADGLAKYRPGESEWDSLHLVQQTLTRAQLDGDAPFKTLSTGNKRRTLLARALVIEPDILLLDEPTNHLDIDAIDWLEGELNRFKGTLFFVTHDRAFLRRLAQRILELDRGNIRDWTCDFATFLTRRDEYLRTENAQRAEFDRKLAEEEVWIRKGVRDRRTRNEGRVRALQKMRSERADRREQAGGAKIQLQDVEKSGRLVMRTRDLSFSWGDKIMVEKLNTMIMRGDKIGILGPNGSGKTTMLRLLLGELQPTGGEIHEGTKLKIAYFDQQRSQLDETQTVLENVSGGNDTVLFNGRSLHIVSYMQNFLFTPDRARSPITQLSGGERNRLLLARLFTQPANLLVMDEPTNDLDLETLELLEEILIDFDGTMLLVSHDREFLDNVATSTLALEGNGVVTETVGGYSDWDKVSKAAKAAKMKAAQPTKAVQKKEKPKGPRRLTFKEGKELEVLPKKIEDWESEQAALHEDLADPRLYQEAPEKVKTIRTRLDELELELETAYSRWEELDSI
ncbi:MAG: ATP-binding cassette domain-containing protein [bacterium]|nr:ATP-binding cassette domain-containing protein [bacterium]